MDVSLHGTEADLADAESEVTREEVLDAIAEAKDFLARYTTAKIIVVIDTHCVENGAFLWTGDSSVTFQSCSLLEAGLLRIALRWPQADTSTDTPRLHPTRGLPVPLECTWYPKAQAQEYHPESGMWSISEQRLFTLFAT